jgi:hypothetical protein
VVKGQEALCSIPSSMEKQEKEKTERTKTIGNKNK